MKYLKIPLDWIVERSELELLEMKKLMAFKN